MKHPLLTSDTMSIKGKELLNKIKDDFIGLDTKYKTVDGKIIGQTGAIARYCGKIANLYSNINFNAAKIDQIFHLLKDFTADMIKMIINAVYIERIQEEMENVDNIIIQQFINGNSSLD